METKLNFINNIPLPVPERKIYSRLGHNRHLTEMSAGQKAKIEAAVANGVAQCRLRCVWRSFKITKHTSECVEFGDGNVFKSSRLAAMLANSGSILLFAVTAGAEVVEETSRLSAAGNGVGALACDAAGSEMVDAAAGWMQQYINQQLKRHNQVLTKRRFSPGYGDLALENQVLLFKLLDIEKLGVKLTDDFLMSPEKTVTAIAGIEHIN